MAKCAIIRELNRIGHKIGVVMAKRLFLLFLVCVFEMTGLSLDLTAADTFVSGMPDFAAVETVPEPEPEPEPEPAAPLAPVAGYEVPVKQTVNYTVTIYSGEMVVHNLSYGDLYKTGKLIYGHNSSNLLGNLGHLSIGEVFTITEGGVTSNYQVTNMVMYEKTPDGFLNGDWDLMGQIMRTAMGNDVAIMTCAGQSYGNGDASHRLVVYANRV